MRRRRLPRPAVWALLAACAGNVGCHHHYYYGALAPCPPTVTSATAAGEVCEVPQAGGTLVTPAPVTSGIVSRPSKVVVSEPRGGLLQRGGGNRIGWRRTDPEPQVITKVEGALEEETIR